MKHIVQLIMKYIPWFAVLLCADLAFIFFLWIVDFRVLSAMTCALFLGTALLFSCIVIRLVLADTRRRAALKDFIETPSDENEKKLLQNISRADEDMVAFLKDSLVERDRKVAEMQLVMEDYEGYVEAWAHEIKTPVSLLTFMIDNNRNEIPDSVCFKMDYVRNHVGEYVNQLLFYSRLESGRKDYYFEEVNITSCMEDVMDDYEPLLKEKQFDVRFQDMDVKVYADKRNLRFIIGQIVSNSVKYATTERQPVLQISCKKENADTVLTIRDNGMGVRESDIPFLFEKGFTGNSGEVRKKATGMGLYLVKKISQEMGLKLEVSSTWGSCFEIKIIFPDVDKK